MEEQATEVGGKSPRQGKQRATHTAVQTSFLDIPLPSKEPVALRHLATRLTLDVREIPAAELGEHSISGVMIGLGFEDRTLAASEFLAARVRPQVVHTVRYSLEGHARQIEGLWTAKGVRPTDWRDAETPPELEGTNIVDVSGLSKPFIYMAIRNELLRCGRVIVCHARAKAYYPLQEDLERIEAAERTKDTVAILRSLGDVLTGERPPYREVPLLREESDPLRRRALLAFASPKHQRLLALLDKREFDSIEVIAPNIDTPRARVARYVAEFVSKNYSNALVSYIDTDDLVGLTQHLDDRYLDVYGADGAELELGLTGSKIQAIASAILSAQRKIAQVWYVSPSEFDAKRFSTGVESIRLLEIRLMPPDRVQP